MTEIKNTDTDIKIYVEYNVSKDKIKIENINIVAYIYGIQVDITDDIMYYMNRPQNHKQKKEMFRSIIQEIQNEDPTTDLF